MKKEFTRLRGGGTKCAEAVGKVLELYSGNVKLGVKNIGMGMFRGVEEPEEPAEQGLKGKAFADCRGAPCLWSFRSRGGTS